MKYESISDFRQKITRHLMQTVIHHFILPDAETELEVRGANAIPSLSEFAQDLLIEAVQDPQGVIMRMATLGGTYVKTNNRDFIEQGNPRSEAKWRAAVDELIYLGLVEDRAGRGEIFNVTDTGYRTAEGL